MQRWMAIALLGASLTGCHLTVADDASVPEDKLAPDAATCTPQVPPNACAAKAENVVLWDPKLTLPVQSANFMWVYLASDNAGYTPAIYVDTVKLTIDAIYVVPPHQLGAFIDALGNGTRGAGVFTGHPNPPPPWWPWPPNFPAFEAVLDGMEVSSGLAKGNADVAVCHQLGFGE